MALRNFHFRCMGIPSDRPPHQLGTSRPLSHHHAPLHCKSSSEALQSHPRIWTWKNNQPKIRLAYFAPIHLAGSEIFRCISPSTLSDFRFFPVSSIASSRHHLRFSGDFVTNNTPHTLFQTSLLPPTPLIKIFLPSQIKPRAKLLVPVIRRDSRSPSTLNQ